jgi:hypothetical protein
MLYNTFRSLFGIRQLNGISPNSWQRYVITLTKPEQSLCSPSSSNVPSVKLPYDKNNMALTGLISRPNN